MMSMLIKYTHHTYRIRYPHTVTQYTHAMIIDRHYRASLDTYYVHTEMLRSLFSMSLLYVTIFVCEFIVQHKHNCETVHEGEFIC